MMSSVLSNGIRAGLNSDSYASDFSHGNIEFWRNLLAEINAHIEKYQKPVTSMEQKQTEIDQTIPDETSVQNQKWKDQIHRWKESSHERLQVFQKMVRFDRMEMMKAQLTKRKIAEKGVKDPGKISPIISPSLESHSAVGILPLSPHPVSSSVFKFEDEPCMKSIELDYEHKVFDIMTDMNVAMEKDREVVICDHLLDRRLDKAQMIVNQVEECYDVVTTFDGNRKTEKLEEFGNMMTSWDPGDSIIVTKSFSNMFSSVHLAEEVWIAYRFRIKKLMKDDIPDEALQREVQAVFRTDEIQRTLHGKGIPLVIDTNETIYLSDWLTSKTELENWWNIIVSKMGDVLEDQFFRMQTATHILLIKENVCLLGVSPRRSGYVVDSLLKVLSKYRDKYRELLLSDCRKQITEALSVDEFEQIMMRKEYEYSRNVLSIRLQTSDIVPVILFNAPISTTMIDYCRIVRSLIEDSVSFKSHRDLVKSVSMAESKGRDVDIQLLDSFTGSLTTLLKYKEAKEDEDRRRKRGERICASPDSEEEIVNVQCVAIDDNMKGFLVKPSVTLNEIDKELNLVDPAGSERQKSSGAEDERFKEAANINKSLSTLGFVIMNLVSVSNRKSVHDAYRNDKATSDLKLFGDNLKLLEDELPLDNIYKSKDVNAACTQVIQLIYKYGDVTSPQTVAFKVPNDEQIVKDRGTSMVMLKNVQEAEFEHILKLVNEITISKEQQGIIDCDPLFTHTICRECLHGIGPHTITLHDGQTFTVRNELKGVLCAMEEAKANILGLWALKFLITKGLLPKDGVLVKVHRVVCMISNNTALVEVVSEAVKGDVTQRVIKFQDKLGNVVQAEKRALWSINSLGLISTIDSGGPGVEEVPPLWVDGVGLKAHLEDKVSSKRDGIDRFGILVALKYRRRKRTQE